MNAPLKLIKSIEDKDKERSSLLAQLKARGRLTEFLRGQGVEVDDNSRFTCGVIGRGGKVVGFRFNGVKHRVTTNMTIPDWFATFGV